MFPENVDTFVSVINYLGILAFAFSGALAGMKREADVFGVLLLSLIACSCGGIIRDVLIGDLPPELLRSNVILIIAICAGLLTFFFFPRVSRLARPIDVFDALGLGLFAVVGAAKGLRFGINPVWSIGLGLVTAVGGGIARDMMLAQVPTILKSEIYATPALIGAGIMVAGTLCLPGQANVFMLTGAVICSGLRLMAIKNNWHIRR